MYFIFFYVGASASAPITTLAHGFWPIPTYCYTCQGQQGSGFLLLTLPGHGCHLVVKLITASNEMRMHDLSVLCTILMKKYESHALYAVPSVHVQRELYFRLKQEIYIHYICHRRYTLPPLERFTDLRVDPLRSKTLESCSPLMYRCRTWDGKLVVYRCIHVKMTAYGLLG